MSTDLKSLRYRVAEALYTKGGKASTDFASMSETARQAWLNDADRVIPIVYGCGN